MLYKLVRAELGLLLKQISLLPVLLLWSQHFSLHLMNFYKEFPYSWKVQKEQLEISCLFLHTGNIPNTLNSKNFNSSR